MKITALTLDAGDLQPLYEFYLGDLGFPLVRRTADEVAFQVGSTRLAFRRGSRAAFYHFALNVHPTRFERARAHFAAITPLLHDIDGQEVFDFRSWHARASYFYDPGGNIVEMIARRDMGGTPVPPDPALLAVSEIGLVTDDVPALAARIMRTLGVPVYRDALGETFGALGDAEGLFILAERGRMWHPNTGKTAAVAPIECCVEVGPTSWQVAGPPYRFARSTL